MELKRCTKCGQEKILSEFHTQKRRHKLGGRIHRSQCKECVNAYNRKHTEENKEKYLARYSKKRSDNKTYAVLYLGAECEDCNKSFPNCCYDFHHTDPSTKEMDATRILNLTREKMLAELDKCVLLCANCHRLRHYYNDDGPKKT